MMLKYKDFSGDFLFKKTNKIKKKVFEYKKKALLEIDFVKL